MIKNFFISNKKPIFLFLLMFILELAIIFVLSQKNSFGIFSRSDGNDYQGIVKNLINHGTFSLDVHVPFLPTNFRTPIYPFWLALIYLIFGSFKPAIFIGAALFALSAPLAYLIGKEIFSEKIAFISTILFAIEPWALFQAGFLVADQIFIPVFLFTIYIFCRYLKSGRRSYLYPAVLLLSLTVLIRPITLYFSLIFAFFVFIFEAKNSIWRSLKITVFAGLVFVLTLSPWMIRNKIVLNTWQISSVSDTALYVESYILDKYLGKITNEDEFEKAGLLLNTRNYEIAKQADKAKILDEYAIKEIRANLGSYIIMHMKAVPLFLVKNSYGNIFLDLKIGDPDIQSKINSYLAKRDLKSLVHLAINTSFGTKFLILLAFLWPIITFLMILGFLFGVKESPRNLFFWFLFLWILYFTGVAGTQIDISRYKLAINTPMFLFAVYGFYKIKSFLTFNSESD